MTRTTEAARQRRNAALHIPAVQRRDCCAGCRYSTASAHNTALHCAHRRCQVGAMAYCAMWAPVPARVVWCGVAA